MKFDFDTPVDRRNTSSYKWDSCPDSDMIAMWVADMDFRTAPSIINALRQRIDGGVFGYTRVPEQYYRATIDWFATHHALTLNRDHFIYTSGVVPAISAVIKALSRPGDGVIVQTPVYNCFYSSIRNNKCRIVENPLIYTPLSNNEFTYRIDFMSLERLCAQPDNTILLLCNPHNPGGMVWTPDDLNRIVEICRRHNVRIISDEIHCELILPDNPPYTPILSIDAAIESGAVMCSSPSKAFNIAGLQIANIVCPDSRALALIDRAINDNEVCDVNPFGVDALIAAYTDGISWLEALKTYLGDNYRHTLDFFHRDFPQLPVSRMQATYLPWIDIRPLGVTGSAVEQCLKRHKVWINGGAMYGDDNFIRLNIATSRTTLDRGLERIACGLNEIIAGNG